MNIYRTSIDITLKVRIQPQSKFETCVKQIISVQIAFV